MEKGYKEILRNGKYIVYGSGNWRIIYDIENKKKVVKYNALFEDIKSVIKKIGGITGLAFAIFSPFFYVKNSVSSVNSASSSLAPSKNCLEKNCLETKVVTESAQKSTTENVKKEKAEKIDLKASYKTFSYITPSLAEKIIFVESSNNPHAISPKGARGLPQTYFEIWKEVFPNDSYEDFLRGVKDKKKSKEFVLKYTTKLDKFLEDNMPSYKFLSPERKIEYIAAAYNCGPLKLKQYNWDFQRIKETRNYVKKINNAFNEL